MLPPDIALGAYRVAHFNEEDHEEARGSTWLLLKRGASRLPNASRSTRKLFGGIIRRRYAREHLKWVIWF